MGAALRKKTGWRLDRHRAPPYVDIERSFKAGLYIICAQSPERAAYINDGCNPSEKNWWAAMRMLLQRDNHQQPKEIYNPGYLKE
jgi:hypothetical protein